MATWNRATCMLALLYVGGVFAGCGTAHPFSRGEIEATPTPDEGTGDDDAAGDDDATAGDDDTTGGDDDQSSPTPEPTSFSADVKPLLQTCTGCHAAGAGDWTYDGGANAYAQVLPKVDVSDPANSLVLIKATGGDSHGGGQIYQVGSSSYNTILAWIEEGARDN